MEEDSIYVFVIKDIKTAKEILKNYDWSFAATFTTAERDTVVKALEDIQDAR